MRRRVDLKWLGGLLALTILPSVGVTFLHGYQVKRNARVMLDESVRAEEQKDLVRAADYVGRYLALEPGDSEARGRLGGLLDQLAVTPQQRLRAVLEFEEVLRRQPDREAIRRRIVRQWLALGRFADARDHLVVLLYVAPDDGELLQAMGKCEEVSTKYEEAVQAYTKATDALPNQLECYVRSAFLLRNHLGRSDEADQIINKMVEATKGNPNGFQAYLERAYYRKQFGLPEAEKDAAKARELAPDAVEVLLALAEFAEDRKDWGEARGHLQHGLEAHPREARFYQALADLELVAGQPEKAQAALRRGLEVLTERADLLWSLADLLLAQRQLAEADELLGRLRKLGAAPARLDFLRARWLVVQEQWTEAIPVLERTVPELAALPQLAKQALHMLAQCYEQLGDTDRQLAACRRALALDSLWAPARIALARALVAVGRPDEALEQYRPLVGSNLEASIAAARLVIERNLRLPVRERRWQEAETLCATLAKRKPTPPVVVLLRADLLAAQDRLDPARELLANAVGEQPDKVALHAALATVLLRQGKAAASLAVLDGARQKLNDSPELFLARLNYWAQRKDAAGHAALEKMAAECATFPKADQPRLLQALGDVAYQAGDTKEPLKLWSHAAELQPNDLRVRLQLFDLALDTGDQAVLERLLVDLRRLEGSDGALWRYGEAALLYLRGRQGDRLVLPRARRLLAEAGARRPMWAQVPLLLARIDDLERNANRALENYQRATDLGIRHPAVIRRLVQLLYENRRYGEADLALRNLLQEANPSPELQRLAAEVSLQNRDFERALELAQKAVSAGSPDYRDHLWLGQVLSAAGRTPETQARAEAALRRAVQLAEKVPDTWVALLQHLTRTGQQSRAEALLKEVPRKLPPDQAPLVLAPYYELTGNVTEAEKQYKAALTARPDDLALLHHVADYYLRSGRLIEAEAALRRIFDPRLKASENDLLPARRGLALAMALAPGSDAAHFQEALELLEENLKLSGPNAEDLRAKGTLLATRPNHRREAIRLFEELVTRKALPADEQFLLARLYEEDHEWSKARDRLLLLLSQDRDNPRYVAYFARALLRRGEVDEAETWLRRLESRESNTLRTVEIRLRVLKAQNRENEALAALLPYVQTKGANLPVVAGLLDELGLGAAAKELYDKYLQPTARPENLVPYIRYLSGQKRLAEALDQCERAWKLCAMPIAATLSLDVLRANPASDEQYRRVEGWITAAGEKKLKPSDAVFLLICQSELWELQGRFAEVEAQYRRILSEDRANVFALNNLAWFLARRLGQGSEALTLINQAIERKGPLAELLDTRAAVYLTLGEPERAVRDLQDALAQKQTAVGFFHLAEACSKAKNRRAAIEAWRKASEAGLKVETLHPLEKTIYTQLFADLETATPPPGKS